MTERKENLSNIDLSPIARETNNRIAPPPEIQLQLSTSQWHILLLGDRLGDMMMVLPVLHGLREVKRNMQNPHGIQLYVNENLFELLMPLNSLPEIETVQKVDSGWGTNTALSNILYSSIQKHVLFNFSEISLPNDKEPEKLYKPIYADFPNSDGLTVYELQGISQYIIWSYTSDIYEKSRYTAFTEDITGIKRGSLDNNAAQPKIVLPQNKQERKQRVMNESKMNVDSPYVILIPQVGKEGMEYPLPYWAQIAEASVKNGYQVSMLIDEHNNRNGSRFEEIQKAMTDAGIANDIHYVSGSLLDIACFGEDAAFFISSDTGPAHLLLSIPDGPKGSTLNITSIPFARPKYWRSSWERQMQFESDALENIDPLFVLEQTMLFAR